MLCLLLLLLTVAGCSGTVSVSPPKPSPDNSSARAVAAQQVLARLAHELSSGTRAGTVALAAPGSARLLGGVFDNARTLRLRDLSFRYVDEQDGALSTAEQRRFGGDAWAAAVDIGYRIPHYDPAVTHMETSFVFDTVDGRARIAAVGGHGDRAPSWLLGRLSVVRTPRTLVLATNRADARTFGPLARHAVSDVDKVLTRWHGPLVVEVPASEQQLDSMLHAPQQQYADIAAVTTTVNGTVVPGTPVHVFVNPRIWATLKRKGAQVVLSHEATHVATKAAFADMPTWLLEGFADYVALDHAGVGVDVAAKQILARIRKHGPPSHLPTANDLSPTANGLGATYEEAWLACRFIAQRYGERQLVRFYFAVDASHSTARAFPTVLGTTQQAVVRAWRADLRRLAGRAVAR